MDPESLRQKLLGAARRQESDDEVPYAFEDRVLAHVRPLGRPQPGLSMEAWISGFHRAALSAVGIAVFCCICALWPSSERAAEDLDAELDDAVIAVVEETQEML